MMDIEKLYEENPDFRFVWDCLTDKEKRFVDKYLMTQNAVESAVYAGYSEKSARSSAYEVLRKEKVQNAIFFRQNNHVKRFHLETKDDAEKFLVEMIHKTYTSGKFHNSLSALEMLANFKNWNSAKQIDINKKEIKVSFFEGNQAKKTEKIPFQAKPIFPNEKTVEDLHLIKLQNEDDQGNLSLES